MLPLLSLHVQTVAWLRWPFLRHAWNNEICWQSVKDNSARRLDRGDIIPSCSEVELQTELKSFTTAHLGSNWNSAWIEQLEAHSSNPASQFMPVIWNNPRYCIYLNTEVWQCSQDFQEQDGRGVGSVRAIRSGLTASFNLLPRVLDEWHPNRPVNIP